MRFGKRLPVLCAALLVLTCATPVFAAQIALAPEKAAYVNRLASTRGQEYGDYYKDCLLTYEADTEPVDLVFLGDSLTYRGDWSTLSDTLRVANRGIDGDTIAGVSLRLDQLKALSPRAVFLLIGVNDFTTYMRPDVYRSYGAFLDQLTTALPDATIYVEGILPVRDDMRTIMGSATVDLINKNLRTLATDRGLTFIDCTEALRDPADGRLRRAYTVDGLHLSPDGYTAWKSVLAPYVEKLENEIEKDAKDAGDAKKVGGKNRRLLKKPGKTSN